MKTFAMFPANYFPLVVTAEANGQLLRTDSIEKGSVYDLTDLVSAVREEYPWERITITVTSNLGEVLDRRTSHPRR